MKPEVSSKRVLQVPAELSSIRLCYDPAELGIETCMSRSLGINQCVLFFVMFRLLHFHRKFILTIPDVTDGEKLHRFFSGMKYEKRGEILKSSV